MFLLLSKPLLLIFSPAPFSSLLCRSLLFSSFDTVIHLKNKKNIMFLLRPFSVSVSAPNKFDRQTGRHTYSTSVLCQRAFPAMLIQTRLVPRLRLRRDRGDVWYDFFWLKCSRRFVCLKRFQGVVPWTITQT